MSRQQSITPSQFFCVINKNKIIAFVYMKMFRLDMRTFDKLLVYYSNNLTPLLCINDIGSYYGNPLLTSNLYFNYNGIYFGT